MRVLLTGPVFPPGLRGWLNVPEGESLPSTRIGGTTPVTQLAAGLLQAGDEVVVVTLDPTVRTELTYEGPRLRLRVLPARAAHRTRDLHRYERKALGSALEEEDADLVHAHWTYEYALAAMNSGKPVLVTVRDWAPTILRLRPNAHKLERLLLNAAVFAKCRQFTVTSPYMFNLVSRWARGHVTLVPNALADEHFVDPPDALRSGPIRLLAVNNADFRRKNLANLLRAWPPVQTTHPGATLQLVGMGYGVDEETHQWAVQHDLVEGVEFLGQVSNSRVHELMGQASLFVHPALEESFGLVLVEAMARGLPVVAGRDSGAVPWVLDHGRVGRLVDVRDVGDIARNVLSLLAEPSRRAELAKLGWEHAWTHFRLSAAVEQYQALYATVAEHDQA